MASRSAQIEENLRVSQRRSAAGNDALIGASVLSNGSAPATPTSPRNTRRERGFWQGPFSPAGSTPRQGTPKRLSHGYGMSTAGKSTRRDPSEVDLGSIDWNEVDVITAIRRMLRLSGQTEATGLVCNLCSALSDDLGATETMREVRKFIHYDRVRSNRLVPPPEGWEAVREAVVKRHGSSRAAFVNMCGGRRGGVMSSEELHRGMIALSMPHVTDRVLTAICPDQNIKADDIFIDFDEFMWIMRGCCDEVPLEHEHSDQFEERRYLELEKDRNAKADQIARLEKRLSQLETSGARIHYEADTHERASHFRQGSDVRDSTYGSRHDLSTRRSTERREESPHDYVSRSDSPSHEYVVSHQAAAHEAAPIPSAAPVIQMRDYPSVTTAVRSRPEVVSLRPNPATQHLMSVWGDGEFPVREESARQPPSSPTTPSYRKSPSFRRTATSPRSPTRRFTSPPKSVPPAAEDQTYPNKVMPSVPYYRSGGLPAAAPTSPTLHSVRSFGAGGLSISGGSVRGNGISPSRISSTIKSPVRRGPQVARVPGMVTPPRSIPGWSGRDEPNDNGFAIPSSPAAYKRPPAVKRNGSTTSSHLADTTTKGPPPAPPVAQPQSQPQSPPQPQSPAQPVPESQERGMERGLSEAGASRKASEPATPTAADVKKRDSAVSRKSDKRKASSRTSAAEARDAGRDADLNAAEVRTEGDATDTSSICIVERDTTTHGTATREGTREVTRGESSSSSSSSSTGTDKKKSKK